MSSRAALGSILIAKDGKILLEKGYGMANVELSVANTPQTKFRLGSITKQFTATAILQLQEQGKPKVGDLVSVYFPGSPPAWKDITIHHLLTHTSGIPNYTDGPGFLNVVRNRLTVLQLIGTSRGRPLDFEPGSREKYSNSGYEVLGYIIEKVSGTPYEQYLRKNIFDRLEMRASGYAHAGTILKNRASGYAIGDGKIENARFIDMSVPDAAGSLYSTVEDLYRWDRGLYTEKVLNKPRSRPCTPRSRTITVWVGSAQWASQSLPIRRGDLRILHVHRPLSRGRCLHCRAGEYGSRAERKNSRRPG